MVAQGELQDIVVVGGGGAGSILVRQLLPKLRTNHRLTLVNARPFHLFLPTTVRMAVTDDGNLEDKLLLPFDHLLGNRGRLVVDTAVAIEPSPPSSDPSKPLGGHIVLKSGERLHYDVLVLSPGTRLASPLDYPDTEEEVRAYVAGWRNKIKDAKHIVFSGGGPVSVELAGEIKEYFPEKTTTIVQSRALPFTNAYPDKFRARILSEAREAGIEFVLEDYLDESEPSAGYVTTRKGQRLRADLVITAHGGTPNTHFVASLGESALDEYGQVRVRDTLELTDFPGIFCVGDAVSNAERNRLGKYPRHARAVVPNLLARLEGSTPRSTYAGSIETLRVSIGSNRGVMTFGAPWFWPWGIVFGSWMTVGAQSRDLILPKGYRMMGLSQGWSRAKKEA
ncbi:FAD/NAD(P)-binding domain-containing protein [Peniophora sp. CONT]|nr:FAD/NAD(P)-binding domain-containing protein [Peniophora sp. CONT]